jgi:hypothetical protein
MCCWDKGINILVLLEGGGVSELEDRPRMAGIRIKTVLRVGSLMRREAALLPQRQEISWRFCAWGEGLVKREYNLRMAGGYGK